MTAGLWALLISLIAAPFRAKVQDAVIRDPETLLKQAQDEMRQNQAKNRERAVQAITQKNNLQAELDKTHRIVERLEQRAEQATTEGKSEEAERLRASADGYRAAHTQIAAALERATNTTEAIKDAIRREERAILSRVAHFRAASIEMALPLPPCDPLPTATQRSLEALKDRVAQTRDMLWREAQEALKAGEDTRAIRLLAEYQNLDVAMAFGYRAN